MKVLLTILFSIQFIISFPQNTEVKKILNDIIKKQLVDFNGEIRISTLIDSSWVEYHLSRLKNSNEKEFKLKSQNGVDTLILTKAEKDLIIRFFENPKNLKLITNYRGYATIDTAEVSDYLKRNNTNKVIYISKPLFIRQGRVGVVFFANLCCGGEGGVVNFSFYQKENERWKRWIDISSGDF